MLLLMMMLMLLQTSRPSLPGPRKPPHVLFVVADDMRPQLGLYGTQAATPHIDALGKRGVMFSRAFAQFPWCSPSRQSFMTGRRPDTTQAWTFTTSFRDALPNAISLPEHFRRQGWYAVSVGKLFHGRNCVRGDPGCCPAAGNRPGAPGSPASGGANSSRCSRGNVWLANPPDGDWRGGNGSWSEHPVDYARVYCHGLQDGLHPPVDRSSAVEWCGVNASFANESDWADYKVAQTAIVRLRAHAADRPQTPLFLGVGFRDDHLPWASPANWHSRVDPATVRATAHGQTPNFTTTPMMAWQYPANGVSICAGAEAHGSRCSTTRWLPPSVLQEALASYMAAIAFTDEQLGKVLAAFDEVGYANNTVTLFAGDQ